MSTERRSFRIWLAEHFLHFGWALFGQECDCGYNRFLWLARRIDGNANWDDDHDCPVGFWHTIRWHVGHGCVLLHGRLMPRGD